MKHKGFSGTWKLNLERSDIPPVTKSQIVTIETDGNSVNMLEEIINDKGEYLKITFKGKFDGMDYPIEGTPFVDTESYRLLKSNIIEATAKKNGRICVKETGVLSESGDTIEVTYLSFDEDGKVIKNFGYFERVEKD